MSQADVELLRRGFEAFARQGIAGVFEFATDDFELVTPLVGQERSLGREETISALEDQFEVFEDWSVEPEEFMRDGKAARLTIHTDKEAALAALGQTRRQ